MENTLMCNLKKCRKVLSTGQVWVTSCSHMFCSEDGERSLAQEKKCPVCDHALSGKLDIVRVDLNPSEAYKSMVLCGLHPEIIMDICSRALNFWIFQNRQEYLMKNHHYEKLSDKYAKLEKYCNKMMNNWQQEAKAVSVDLQKSKNELHSYKRRCEECVLKQVRFLCHVLRKKQLEHLVLTRKVEGRRARGRQRMIYLGWLSRVTNRTKLAIIRKCMERQEHLIVADLSELLRDKTRQLQKVQSSYSAHRQSSMQMQMSQSLNASPQKGSKAKHDDLIRNKQEFSAFDLPIGGTVQHSPPEKDCRNFENAFRFNVSSIPSSPFVFRRPESTPTH